MRGLLPALGLLVAVLLLAASARGATPQKILRAEARRRALLEALGLDAVPPGVRVVVEKAARRLRLEAGDRVLLEAPVGLGGAPEGHKLREGDLRTPEGEYYVCTRNPQSRFHLFLGVSYPGPADARAAREEGRISAGELRLVEDAHAARKRPPWNTDLGGQIGIHGHGAGGDWTLGCVAVDDDVIETLWFLCPLGTPVLIRP